MVGGMAFIVIVALSSKDDFGMWDIFTLLLLMLLPQQYTYNKGAHQS
jgi:hypothetical protein